MKIPKEKINQIVKELTNSESVINNIENINIGDYIITVFVNVEDNRHEVREGFVIKKLSSEITYRPNNWESGAYSLKTNYQKAVGKSKLLHVLKPEEYPEYFI